MDYILRETAMESSVASASRTRSARARGAPRPVAPPSHVLPSHPWRLPASATFPRHPQRSHWCVSSRPQRLPWGAAAHSRALRTPILRTLPRPTHPTFSTLPRPAYSHTLRAPRSTHPYPTCSPFHQAPGQDVELRVPFPPSTRSESRAACYIRYAPPYCLK